MNINESKTPRTDAEFNKKDNHNFGWQFARTLELELQKLQRQNAELAASDAMLRYALKPFSMFACGCSKCANCVALSVISTPPSDALKPWVEAINNLLFIAQDYQKSLKNIKLDATPNARQLLQNHGIAS